MLWTTHPGGVVKVIGFDNGDSAPLDKTSMSVTQARLQDSTVGAIKSGLTSEATGVRKRVSTWGGSTCSVTGDGAAPATGTFDGVMGSTAVAIGCAPNGSAQIFGTVKNVKISLAKTSDAQLQILSA